MEARKCMAACMDLQRTREKLFPVGSSRKAVRVTAWGRKAVRVTAIRQDPLDLRVTIWGRKAVRVTAIRQDPLDLPHRRLRWSSTSHVSFSLLLFIPPIHLLISGFLGGNLTCPPLPLPPPRPAFVAAVSPVPEPRPASASPSAACRGGGAGLAAMALATCQSRSCTPCAQSAGHHPPRISLCTTHVK
eukprot:1161747-Pelagomonas_calceolata.AAC.5